MTAGRPGRVWGRQYPFERNQLQRDMALAGLVGVLAVAVLVLIHAQTRGVLGVAMICSGVLALLGAMSRRRYIQETRLGFTVLRDRGAGFVVGSALLFCVTGALVAAVVLLE